MQTPGWGSFWNIWLSGFALGFALCNILYVVFT